MGDRLGIKYRAAVIQNIGLSMHVEALRAELLERCEAHERTAKDRDFFKEREQEFVNEACALALKLDMTLRELAARCELTDPVVQAARDAVTNVPVNDATVMIERLWSIRVALRALEGGDE